ncbi:MAG: hypothetical protein IPK19_39000 [Chloroflexi bacterium]|nr:hypothetical protein [Chloroflexota bacterium]
MTQHEPQHDTSAATRTYRALRIRRRSTAEWLAWVLWIVLLAVLLEYSLGSFAEYEQQAGILAGALFVGLLIAGVIIHFMRGIDVRSPYRDPEFRRDRLHETSGYPSREFTNGDSASSEKETKI